MIDRSIRSGLGNKKSDEYPVIGRTDWTKHKNMGVYMFKSGHFAVIKQGTERNYTWELHYSYVPFDEFQHYGFLKSFKKFTDALDYVEGLDERS